MKAPDTKTILNVSLIIAIILVGKKIGEKLGIFETKQDVTALELETGSTENVQNTSSTAPVGLALNPNYWISIYKSININRQSKGLPKLTGKEILKSLTIAGTNPALPIKENLSLLDKSIKALLFIPNYLKDLLNDVKSKNLNPLEQTYAILCYKIYDSKGIFNDEEDSIYNSFQILNSKAQISYLSNTFSKIYNKDLLSYLKNFLNSDELTKIYQIIKNKPLAK